MDMINSCSKKYLFKTRKRVEVDVERLACGHIVKSVAEEKEEKIGLFSLVNGG